jgi:uncharacterized membrane protein
MIPRGPWRVPPPKLTVCSYGAGRTTIRDRSNDEDAFGRARKLEVVPSACNLFVSLMKTVVAFEKGLSCTANIGVTSVKCNDCLDNAEFFPYVHASLSPDIDRPSPAPVTCFPVVVMIVNVPRVIHLLTMFAVSCWCALILLAPLLTAADGPLQAAGRGLYLFFGQVCHQLDDRSFHLEGHPLAVCARCSGIYFGFLAGTILYPTVARRCRFQLPARSVLLAGAAPMFLDVAVGVLGLYEATNTLRVATGAWFGITTSWCVLPPLFEAGTRVLQDSSAFRISRLLKGSTSV